MAVAVPTKKKTVIKHVREVNNYIRKKVLDGKNLEDDKDRNEIIQAFLDDCTTTTGRMTPELFLFFLQKLNAHGLFEQLDNDEYTIVFPDYTPFDVEAKAAEFGYPSIFATVERNIRDRSRSLTGVKTAGLAVRQMGLSAEVFEKTASANSSHDPLVVNEIAKQLSFDKFAKKQTLMAEARQMFWEFNNLEDFTKQAVFKCNPFYKKTFTELKSSPISGCKDKKATLNDFNVFMDILDKLKDIDS